MKPSLEKILQGYETFRDKYVHADQSIMRYLSKYGQKPQAMVVACCDSRVDPALILQCDPGDLFVVRNVANIVPPYEKDEAHHGTSAALEFGICYLNVKHLILLGHSQCGGIEALFNLTPDENNACQPGCLHQDDFISNWVSVVKSKDGKPKTANDYAKQALHYSYENCMTFPWLKERTAKGDLLIHLWYFDIEKGTILTYSSADKDYIPLDTKTYFQNVGKE